MPDACVRCNKRRSQSQEPETDSDVGVGVVLVLVLQEYIERRGRFYFRAS